MRNIETRCLKFIVPLYIHAITIDLEPLACIPTSHMDITPMPYHALTMSVYLHTLKTEI